MPPKAKITREMIVDAAFEIARADGAEAINARTVSQRLGCSTQPVLYHFVSIDAIRRAVYEKADAYHTAYLTQGGGGLEIAMRYVRFAALEKRLFRLLFQSGGLSGKSLKSLMDAEALEPVLDALRAAGFPGGAQTRKVFRQVFLFLHGYASMLANNEMDYDEAEIALDIQRAYHGAVQMAKEEEA